MIPAAAQKQVHAILPNQTVGFKIKASSKAFKILSSNLYQDKPRAILRELGCNALDAHVAAGIPNEPFVVKLPNQMNEELVIQDFGPGLSHEAIMNLYVTFFDSDKTGTNDMVGGLGLGSKSPFSYTDTFTVTSNHGGMSRVYAAFINEHDSPAITLINESKMGKDDRTGLKIQIPVKTSDASEFSHAARTVFSHFPVKPQMAVQIEEPNYLYEIGIARIKQRAYGNTSKVIMGPVAYRLHTDNLPAKIRQRYNHILDDVDFVANIGDLSIAASREALSYDKHTIEKLEELLRKAEADIANVINKQIKGAANYQDAVIEAKNLSRFMRVKQDLFWQGVRIYHESIKIRFETAYNMHGVMGTTSGLFYTKTPKVRHLRVEDWLRFDEVDCIVIKDTDNKPYIRRLEQIKDEVNAYQKVLTLVVPNGLSDDFEKNSLPLVKLDFPNAEIFQLSKVELDTTTSSPTARATTKAFFSRATITERQSDNSWNSYTQYRFLPRFNEFESEDFTLQDKLNDGWLWAAFNGTTQVELPPQFMVDGLFDENSYKGSFSHFMAEMVFHSKAFKDKNILGVPRALEKQQPQDQSKNAAYVAYNALLELANEENYCKAVAYFKAHKTDLYQTDDMTLRLIKLHKERYPESGMAITAAKLFDEARLDTSLHYAQKFVELTQRVMNELNIELLHTKFIFPKQRWNQFVQAHPLLLWGRELNYRENDTDRVNALIDAMESTYSEGNCK